jgi:hypothetical protein
MEERESDEFSQAPEIKLPSFQAMAFLCVGVFWSFPHISLAYGMGLTSIELRLALTQECSKLKECSIDHQIRCDTFAYMFSDEAQYRQCE